MSDELNKPATDATPGQWVQREQLEAAQEKIRRLDAQLQGQGTGLHALDMLLGYPKDGLIEAVKRLVAERDKYRQLHAMEAESRKATRDGMTVEYDQLRAEVERIRALLDKACEIGLHLASVSRRDESVRYERLTTIRREAKGEG